jgi:transposase
LELRQVEVEIRGRIRSIDAIARLQTIPGIGVLTATTIYAWVGDIDRFPSAKVLSAYAGLVPSVRQSGATQRMGPITKTGSKPFEADFGRCLIRTKLCEPAEAPVRGEELSQALGAIL